MGRRARLSIRLNTGCCFPLPARCGFAEASFGPATRLTVRVNGPEEEHTVTVGKFQSWLNGGAKSPSEKVYASHCASWRHSVMNGIRWEVSSFAFFEVSFRQVVRIGIPVCPCRRDGASIPCAAKIFTV